MTRSELLDVVYRFYPRGVLPYEPRYVPSDERAYDDTEEHRRLVDAARRGRAEYPIWQAMIRRLGERCCLQDESLHLLAGGVDPAYSARIYRPGDVESSSLLGSRASLSFHVCILGPYYGIHDTGETGDESAAIAAEIEATYPGYEPIPPEIGNEVVADVAMDGVSLGQATIYQCLLSTRWPESRSAAASPVSASVQPTITPEEQWAWEAYSGAASCIFVLLRGLARDAMDLGIDRVAWDNTLAVAVWALAEKRAGRVLRDLDRDISREDVDTLRRLAGLGAEALAGGERTPELRQLAERCLTGYAPDWRRMMELLPPGAYDVIPPVDVDLSDRVLVYEGDTLHAVPRGFYQTWRALHPRHSPG